MIRAFLILTLIVSLDSYGDKAGNIIQVTRKLRMSYLEPIPPKEFYIDIGSRDGIKTGDLVEVYRMQPVVNGMSGGAWHLMKLSLGDIKIITVGDSTAIGRLANGRDPQSLPNIDYQGFMVGDQVEIRSQLPFK